jgi:4'-phosphopantetheinyl transferase EntD
MTASAFKLILPAGAESVDTSAGLQPQLYPAEEQFITRARDKRRDEFALGRACARFALRRLGIEDYPLLPDENRAPQWPAGITGSITHSGGYCAVAVARQAEIRSLGIDSELTDRVTENLWRMVCTPRETEWLRAQPADRQVPLATLIFSAKEAVYKCQYQITRSWMGFADVEIEPRDGSFDIRFTSENRVDTRPLMPLAGRYLWHDDHVLCSAVSLAAPPDTSGPPPSAIR